VAAPEVPVEAPLGVPELTRAPVVVGHGRDGCGAVPAESSAGLGSGHKYKKCHGRHPTADPPPAHGPYAQTQPGS
jgi:hypothetical protein